MPLQSTRGAASGKAFGFTAGGGWDGKLDYLVIAGGGGGGGSVGGHIGGGSGGGGYRTSFPGGTKLTVSAGAIPVTVGGGGAGGPPGSNPGSKGADSVFSTITSTGGGYGAGGLTNASGGPGGSGGGAGSNAASPASTGNDPPVSPPQGNNGGGTLGGGGAGGGGGGAGSAGGTGADPTFTPPLAGLGLANSISGSSVTRAAGGPAGGVDTSIVNTGNGNFGREQGGAGGTGSPGIVILRAPAAAGPRWSVAPGTNTKTSAPNGDTIATFTVDGTLTIS
jgi:hypothetical protein